ncbi:DUF397 domain-containing protein [Actinomadura craniellae]|uniref:DUF397 domain-containing protein n=1 Tax=Actinomadura craniellae TaxID=2231787 RepID=A0A365HBH3_9ACTN|nr:DUF397 domain-containing protein [Actinomadura craniellae]RAY16435.1 DUF397 domain-containing protein [Actinomadura craniellae]
MNGADLAHVIWRKSSRSNSQGGTCVEIGLVWHRSSYSETQVSECIEAARAERVVAVRDSKNPDGPVLAFSPAEWRGLLTAIRTGAVAS